MIRVFCFVVIFGTVQTFPGFSQENNNQKIQYTLSTGINVQFFAFEHFLQQPNIPRYDGNLIIAGGGNAEGFGVPLNLKIYHTAITLGLSYETVLRYDVTVPGEKFFGNKGGNRDIYGFFADHHFSIFHNFEFDSKLLPMIRKPIPMYVGIGLSLISPGQAYTYAWSFYDRKTQAIEEGSSVKLSYKGIHLMLGAKIYKQFYFEARFLRVPQNQSMYHLYQSSNMMILKGAYQFELRRRRDI